MARVICKREFLDGEGLTRVRPPVNNLIATSHWVITSFFHKKKTTDGKLRLSTISRLGETMGNFTCQLGDVCVYIYIHTFLITTAH